MYDELSTSFVDIFPATIPVLQAPPSQAIPLVQQHREFRSERVETVISSYTTSLYLRLINWNKIYLIKFPSTLLNIPSVIYYKNINDLGICLNMDLSTARMDIKNNNILISDYTAFAACVLYGINKITFYQMRDQQILSDMYNSVCAFIYSLIIRSYIHDFDLNNMSDQDIANTYYLICKLVGNTYIKVSGNLNALSTVMTQKFFINENKKTQKQTATIKFNIDYLPRDKNIFDFNTLFAVLNEMDIFAGISLSDFRTRINKFFSPTLLSCMGNGLDFISMLASCKIPSEIFSQRILSIRPSSINYLNKSLYKYLLQYANNSSSDDQVIPDGWV